MKDRVRLDGLLLDVRQSARSLLRQPRFAAAAVLTLAVGIGASTTIFSVVYGVLLRELPYRDAARLILIQGRIRSTGKVLPGGFSGPDFEDWRLRLRQVDSLALCSRDIFALETGGGFETVRGAFVSKGFFALLGVRPALGRLPRPGSREIVISDRLWRSRFAADPAVVGRQVRLNASPFALVGVAGPSMAFPTDARTALGAPADTPDLWAPFELSTWANRRSLRVGQLVARVESGRTIQQATAEVAVVAKAFGAEHPDWREDRDAVVVPLADELTGSVRPALWLLLAAVGCLVFVACLNVTNLLLARHAARARDVAVRVALGAPRSRLAAHVLGEAAWLALGGAAIGVMLAAWMVAALRWMEPDDLPRLDAIRVDLPVLAFAVCVSVLSALVSAIAPAWRLLVASRRVSLLAAAGTGAGGTGRAGRRLRSALVVAELGVSLVLLVGAALLVRSFDRLVGTDIGAARDRVTAIEVNLAMGRSLTPAEQIRLADRLVADLQTLPGVTAVGGANGLPPNRSRMAVFFERPAASGTPTELEMGLLNPTPDYFRTLGIPLLRGRLFSRADGVDAPGVAILSASAARRLFGTLDAVGRVLPAGLRKAPATVVGVVGDVRYRGLGEAPADTVYVPFAHFPFRNMVLVARAAGDSRQVARSLAGAVHRVDREVTVGPARTLDEVVSEAVARPRFRAALFSALAGLALVLAGVGLYGLTAYVVSQRTAEIGLRMALGASGLRVVAMIVRESITLAGVGVALGTGGSILATRALSGFLYGVTPHDPGSLATAIAVLVLVTALASVAAARRAARVDPMVALRTE